MFRRKRRTVDQLAAWIKGIPVEELFLNDWCHVYESQFQVIPILINSISQRLVFRRHGSTWQIRFYYVNTTITQEHTSMTSRTERQIIIDNRLYSMIYKQKCIVAFQPTRNKFKFYFKLAALVISSLYTLTMFRIIKASIYYISFNFLGTICQV